MKLYILWATLSVFSVICAFGQPTYVPYRVGNKFGVANEAGELKVAAGYDNVRLCEQANYLAFYKGTDAKFTSSLSYKDKIIIADRAYHTYSTANDIISALTGQFGSASGSKRQGNRIVHIYNNKGERIFPGDYLYCDIFSDFDYPNQSNLVLLGTYDRMENFNLVVYDKKQRKVISTLINNIKTESIDDDNVFYENVLLITGAPVNNMTTIYEISLLDEEYKMVTRQIASQPKYEDYSYHNIGPFHGTLDGRSTELKPTFELYPSIDKIDMSDKPFKRNLLVRGDHHLALHLEIITESDKKGVKLKRDNKTLIPAEYDELYHTAPELSYYSGAILQSGNKYGLWSKKPNREDVLIKPIYSRMPWLEFYDYSKPGFHLIGLYDKTGEFHHFADQSGKEYYSAK